MRDAVKHDLVTVKDDDYVFSEEVIDEANLDKTIYNAMDIERARRETAAKMKDAIKHDLATIKDDDYVFSETVIDETNLDKPGRFAGSTKPIDQSTAREIERMRREAGAVGAVEGLKYGLQDKTHQIKEELAGRKDQVVGAVETAAYDTKNILHDISHKIGGKKDQIMGAIETRLKDFFGTTETRSTREMEEVLRSTKGQVGEAVETAKESTIFGDIKGRAQDKTKIDFIRVRTTFYIS
jgi:hypothetical protein